MHWDWEGPRNLHFSQTPRDAGGTGPAPHSTRKVWQTPKLSSVPRIAPALTVTINVVEKFLDPKGCHRPSSLTQSWFNFYVFQWYYIISAATKSLQSCPTLCNPIDSSPPGSPSLGFSRQEHCSGLPFPSPMHESEKWKWSRSVVSDSQWPHGLQPTGLLHPWDFPGESTGVGCHRLLLLHYIWGTLKLGTFLTLTHTQADFWCSNIHLFIN